MKNNLINAGLYALGLLAVLLFHLLFFRFVLHIDSDFRTIYDFVFGVGVVSLFLIALANRFYHSLLGFIFLVVITLKLIAAGIFVNTYAPLDQTEIKASFIVLYLISIVLITIFTARLLLYPEK